MNVRLQIPKKDWSFFSDLAQIRGWKTFSTEQPKKKEVLSGIDKGLQDIKNGHVYHAKDSAELISQIFG